LRSRGAQQLLELVEHRRSGIERGAVVTRDKARELAAEVAGGKKRGGVRRRIHESQIAGQVLRRAAYTMIAQRPAIPAISSNYLLWPASSFNR
jgi:hypothetical protein